MSSSACNRKGFCSCGGSHNLGKARLSRRPAGADDDEIIPSAINSVLVTSERPGRISMRLERPKATLREASEETERGGAPELEVCKAGPSRLVGWKEAAKLACTDSTERNRRTAANSDIFHTNAIQVPGCFEPMSASEVEEGCVR
eukprot:1653572-Pleurochrysis_carterae.AAC.1